MTKLFQIDTPRHLRLLSCYIKEGDINNVAAVWSATRRKFGGSSVWDGRIMASFYTDGRERHGRIFRIDMNGETLELASLKYNQALDWCFKNLKIVEGESYAAVHQK